MVPRDQVAVASDEVAEVIVPFSTSVSTSVSVTSPPRPNVRPESVTLDVVVSV